MVRFALLMMLVACGGGAPHRSRFAGDAEVAVVAGPTMQGRAAIDAWSARYPGLHLASGRRWIHGMTEVVELAITGTWSGHAVGVPAAAILTFDRAGLIATARVYLDVPTLVGQVSPERLPAGAKTRAPITGPLTGSATTTSTGSPSEAANLATTGAIWARLDAHDPAGVLASSAPGYIYDDYSGPAPLDLDGTHRLLDGFLGLVQDFTIVEKPTYFAAGAFVITESVEHMMFRGKQITLHGLDIKEFVDGRVAREWQYANGAEVLSALLGVTIDLPPAENTP